MKMGRSVSYPHDSIVTFTTFDYDEDFIQFEDFIENFEETAKSLWPSFWKCDIWLDRENHAILENKHTYFGVSEYCGLVALWLVPKHENDPLAWRWISQIEKKFNKMFGTLRTIGYASNGECFFERIS